MNAADSDKWDYYILSVHPWDRRGVEKLAKLAGSLVEAGEIHPAYRGFRRDSLAIVLPHRVACDVADDLWRERSPVRLTKADPSGLAKDAHPPMNWTLG
jgi:hypothetical protein